MADRFFRFLDSSRAAFCAIAGVPGMLVLFITLGLLGQGVFGTGPAHASQSVRFGHIVLEYGDVGHNPTAQSVADGLMSRWEYYDDLTVVKPFSAAEKQQIEQSIPYFATLFSQASPAVTAKIYTGYVRNPDGQGTAFSFPPNESLTPQLTSPNGSIYDAFISGRPVAGYPSELPDNMIMFQYSFSSAPTRLLLDDASVMSTMLHELAHSFGIMAVLDVDAADKTKGTFTDTVFTAWNDHLYDVFGKKAEKNMPISMDATATSTSVDGVFQIFAQSSNPADIAAHRYPTFHGEHVDALTGGKGMPVMGGFSNGGNSLESGSSLGHPGVMHSIMSYGAIRNMAFTEMELAVFQDIGYTIDRSQFFGKSYYYDVGGDTQINTRGFGTAATPNTTLLGLGTHILRNDLTLTQQADIHANGAAGGGVRIDGLNNALTIPAGVTVAADGNMGTGLLVSYGSGNRIALDGTVRAGGEGGIGAHFGMLVAPKWVHSYMTAPQKPDMPTQTAAEFAQVVKDLNGPLVTDFSVSGTLSGKEAAIQIEPDVHVKNINLLSGAHIEGHILSRWDREGLNEASKGTFTSLNVGTVGADGINGTGRRIVVTGNIQGNNGSTNAIDVHQRAGTLHFNGLAKVYFWDIQPGATLTGNSAITLTGTTPLTSAGTIAPGNSLGGITIAGDFVNSGTLLMEFNHRTADVLHVTGSFTHTGTVTAVPVRGYYPSGTYAVPLDSMFTAGSGAVPVRAEALPGPESPTLTMRLADEAGSNSFITERASQAYSRYAATPNAAQVGRALDSLSEQATGDMQTLLATLDFSATHGGDIREALPQLQADPYMRAAQAGTESLFSLGRLAHTQLQSLNRPQGQENTQNPPAGKNDAVAGTWILPFGGLSHQQGSSDLAGYSSDYAGIMGGAYRKSDDVTLGLHTAFTYRTLRTDTAASAKITSQTFTLGAEALWDPEGEGLYAWFQVQGGIENASATRHVSFLDYSRTSKADWTAFMGSASLGTGWMFERGAFSYGPQVGLDYALYAMPDFTESGGGGIRLHTDSLTRHDLQAFAGIALRWSTELAAERAVRLQLDAGWRQPLITSKRHLRSRFADSGLSSGAFTTTEDRQSGGSLGLNGSAQINLRRDIMLSATIDATTQAGTSRNAHHAVGGGVALRWEF